MELDGVVQNGVIVPQGECPLPEGTKVRITPEEEPKAPVAEPASETVGDRLNRLAERFKNEQHDLPADYSVNFEHYLCGTPKRP
jgi:hypothetical protein